MSIAPMSAPAAARCTITVHQRADLGRAGLSTYVIDFKQQGPSTVITTENRKMPPELAAKMQYDIDRWQRGACRLQQENAAGRLRARRSAAGEADDGPAGPLARLAASRAD